MDIRSRLRICGAVLIGLVLASQPIRSWLAPPAHALRAGDPMISAVATVTPPATVTPGPCPIATQEPLWVQPVHSPTSALTQTVEIYAGRALTVTVSSEAGLVTQAGGATWPARITINLLPETAHHLTVKSSIARTVVNGCVFGGYTLQTTRDRYGALLTIVQDGAAPTTPTTTATPLPTVTAEATATSVAPTATAAATETSSGSDADPLYLPLLIK